MRGTAGSRGGIHALLNFMSGDEEPKAVIYTRRWIGVSMFKQQHLDRFYLLRGTPSSPYTLLLGASSWDHYLSVTQFRSRAYARLLTSMYRQYTRRLFHAFCKPSYFESPPDPPQLELTL